MAREYYFDLWILDCICTFTDLFHKEHSLILHRGQNTPYIYHVYVRVMNIFFQNIYLLNWKTVIQDDCSYI